MSKAYQSTFTGETNTPYSKQFVHSKSSQYRRLKTEWKNNVYLARSRIQGLGLYAAKDIEKHTMVIEYIGTIIRNEVANRREKIYEEQVGALGGFWGAVGGLWEAWGSSLTPSIPPPLEPRHLHVPHQQRARH